MSDQTSLNLLARWRDGDERAATEIYERYVGRLMVLARDKLSAGVQRRVSAEDVVQSVCRSFFRVSTQGRYVCERSGDLWNLLSKITLNKVRQQIKFHSAQKRTYLRESEIADIDDADSTNWHPQALAREPTPAEAAGLLEELEFVLSGLEPVHREILERRLQGAEIEEIATETSRSERTVRRVLEIARTKLEKRLLETNGNG